MVEKAECYKTKFGSIHKDEEQARKTEAREEKDDFARALCKVVTDSQYDFGYTVAEFVYDHRADVLKLLTTYDFIEPR